MDLDARAKTLRWGVAEKAKLPPRVLAIAHSSL